MRDTVGRPAPEAVAVPSVTSNSFKVTLKARESQSPVTDKIVTLWNTSYKCFTRTIEVTNSIAHDSYRMSTCITVHRDPTLLRFIETEWERQMGGSPKSLLNSIW